MNVAMFCCGQALQIRDIIVSFVFVYVMNVIAVGNFAVVIFPYNTMKHIIRGVVPAICAFSINRAVKFLVSLVNDFNGWRIGQIAFEDVNPVTFKVVFGVGAKFGE